MGFLIGGAIGLALAVALLMIISNRPQPPEPMKDPNAKAAQDLEESLKAFRQQVDSDAREDREV